MIQGDERFRHFLNPITEDVTDSFRLVRNVWSRHNNDSSVTIYERNTKISVDIQAMYALDTNNPKSLRGTAFMPNQYIYNIVSVLKRITDANGKGSLVFEAYRMF